MMMMMMRIYTHNYTVSGTILSLSSSLANCGYRGPPDNYSLKGKVDSHMSNAFGDDDVDDEDEDDGDEEEAIAFLCNLESFCFAFATYKNDFKHHIFIYHQI